MTLRQRLAELRRQMERERADFLPNPEGRVRAIEAELDALLGGAIE